MKVKILFFLITLGLASSAVFAKADQEGMDGTGCAIVLHGLLRSSYSMHLIEESLEKEGYKVWNKTYPSREKPIATLADIAIQPGLEFCQQQKAKKIHFVTHSLGGILVRKFLQENAIENLGRIVMLSPPNHGTKIVDLLKPQKLFKNIFGPAGQQLGTDNESIVKTLKPIVGEIGIIAGNFSPNPWFSSVIPGEDDGVVSVEGSKLPEMQDFLTFDYSHTLIMKKDDVIRQVLLFLATGRFSHTKEVIDVNFEK